MRSLVFGTSYLYDEASADVLRIWQRLATRLNPQSDVAIIDSASPVPVPEYPGVIVVQLGENIGHLAKGGRDGWGRAFCTGLQMALECGYKYVAHVETDVVLTASVEPLFVTIMKAQGWQAWPETGIMLFNVEWLRQRDFVGAYDWAHLRPTDPEPEWRCRDLIGGDLHYLSELKGRRDEGTVKGDLPADYVWLTHSTMGRYEELLLMRGMSDGQ
jgi:hypothetical protein